MWLECKKFKYLVVEFQFSLRNRFSNVDPLHFSSDSEAMKSIFVRFIRSDVSINIGCIYTPPQNNHDDFISQFEDKLRALNLNSSTCIQCAATLTTTNSKFQMKTDHQVFMILPSPTL